MSSKEPILLRHAYDHGLGQWVDCPTAFGTGPCDNKDHIVHVKDSDHWKTTAKGLIGWTNIRASDHAITTIDESGL